MLRNKLAISILLLGGFGCQQSAKPHRVYVDFEAVLASYKASPLPSHPLPKPPGGLPTQTVSIPAVPAKTVVVQSASGAQAEALLETNRKKAVDELTRLLSRRYLRDVTREGDRLVRDLDPKRKAAYESAQAAVTLEFEKYANQRAPLVARLTSLVGFPDPNPNSVPPPESTPPFAVKRLQEAAGLRKDMVELEASYETKILDLLSQAGKQYDVDLLAIQKQIDQDRAEAMKKAESEAVTEAAKTYKDLRPVLMGPEVVNLPGQPEQSVDLPEVPAPKSAPEVRERTLTPDQRRSILRSQLDIWLKLNGYELVQDSNGVDNKTEEFVKWRQERKL